MNVHENGITELPDGSAFFVAEVDTSIPMGDPIHWNIYNKVVHDHRTGDVVQPDTNVERASRGLPVPWTPSMGEIECRQAPIE